MTNIIKMSDHPFAQAPKSRAPYLKISYYDFQEWLQLIDQDKLSRWELLRFKMMNERYSMGRTFLALPIMGAAYFSAHVVWSYPIRRRDSGFRDNIVFATFFYLLYAHWIDKIQVPDRFLDELFTQSDPNGQYLRQVTKEHHPLLWENIREQLLEKGTAFEEPQD